MKSVLTEKQVKEFRGGNATTHVIATVRYDDQCGNGHNTFSITGEVYGVNGCRKDGTVKIGGRTLALESCGCVHEAIAEHIPELAPYIKWHLCSSDGPMYYIVNTIYLAGDRDHNGLKKGETQQLRNGKTGQLAWVLKCDRELPKHVDADACPAEIAVLRYVPWSIVGKGKERQLGAAREAAIWPDATDAELMQEPELLKAALEARLPKLLEEFKAAVESLGFIY